MTTICHNFTDMYFKNKFLQETHLTTIIFQRITFIDNYDDTENQQIRSHESGARNVSHVRMVRVDLSADASDDVMNFLFKENEKTRIKKVKSKTKAVPIPHTTNRHLKHTYTKGKTRKLSSAVKIRMTLQIE